MSDMNCPHCQSEEFGSTNVPHGVVAVMPCPVCSELVVRFKHKAIALNKEVLYNGSKDERKMHIADVIAEFMDEGILDINMLQSPQFSKDDLPGPPDEAEIDAIDNVQGSEELQLISDDELKKFTDFDLDKLDNVDYFRKTFE
jgi:hypothetical protein